VRLPPRRVYTQPTHEGSFAGDAFFIFSAKPWQRINAFFTGTPNAPRCAAHCPGTYVHNARNHSGRRARAFAPETRDHLGLPWSTQVNFGALFADLQEERREAVLQRQLRKLQLAIPAVERAAALARKAMQARKLAKLEAKKQSAVVGKKQSAVAGKLAVVGKKHLPAGKHPKQAKKKN
jgi:hypothetical protein